MFGQGNGSLHEVWEYIHAERPDLAVKAINAVRVKNIQFEKNCDLLKKESLMLARTITAIDTGLRQNVPRIVLAKYYKQAETMLDNMRKLTRLLMQEEHQEK